MLDPADRSLHHLCRRYFLAPHQVSLRGSIQESQFIRAQIGLQ